MLLVGVHVAHSSCVLGLLGDPLGWAGPCPARALLLAGPTCTVLPMRSPSSSPRPKGSWSKSGVSAGSKCLPRARRTAASRHVSLLWAWRPHPPFPSPPGQVPHSLVGGISEWGAPVTRRVTPAPSLKLVPSDRDSVPSQDQAPRASAASAASAPCRCLASVFPSSLHLAGSCPPGPSSCFRGSVPHPSAGRRQGAPPGGEPRGEARCPPFAQELRVFTTQGGSARPVRGSGRICPRRRLQGGAGDREPGHLVRPGGQRPAVPGAEPDGGVQQGQSHHLRPGEAQPQAQRSGARDPSLAAVRRGEGRELGRDLLSGSGAPTRHGGTRRSASLLDRVQLSSEFPSHV